MNNRDIDEIETTSLINNEDLNNNQVLPIIETNIIRERNHHRSNYCWNIIYFISFILILSSIIYMKFDYENQIAQLTLQLHNLNKDLIATKQEIINKDQNIIKNLDSLRYIESYYENITNQKIHSLLSNITSMDNMLYSHEYQLVRLLNHTNNADVLDQLQLTKEQVKNMLETEHNQIVSHIEASTKDVSDQLTESNRKLQETQHKIDEHLDSSVLNMRHVVDAATSQIQLVQEQVSDQMDNITYHVDIIVHELSSTVHLAQDTIHKEVKSVEDTIEQYVIATNNKFAAENDFVKYQLAGTFTLLGCLLSLWHVNLHLRNYNKPEVQRRIMAVLWMVPIYGVTSWISLVCPKAEEFLSAFRDVYEAYAVYTFIALLIAILLDGKRLQDLINRLADRVVKESHAVEEYEKLKQEQRKGSSWFGLIQNNNNNNNNYVNKNKNITSSLHNKRPIEHIKPPCPCCYRKARPISIAAAWLYQCQLMAFQFVMIKPLFTLLPLILKYMKIYDVNEVPIFIHRTLNWHAPILYIVLVQNLSVSIAFYGLLSFYHGTEKELEWCNPWPKFLCIKGVVFATFWQNIMIQIFSIMGWIDMKAASQIQNLLICIEMLLASVAHFYIFPYEEWIEGYKKEKEKGIMLKDTLALVDFVNDMHLMVSRWDTGDEVEEFTTPHFNKKQTSEAIYSIYNSHNKYSSNSGRSSRASSSAAHNRDSLKLSHQSNENLFSTDHDDRDKISSYNYYQPTGDEEEDSTSLIEAKSYTNYGSCSKDVLIRSNNNVANQLIPIESFFEVGSYQSDSSISSSIMKDTMSQQGGGGSSSLTHKHISELTIQAKQLVLNNLRHIASNESTSSFIIEPPPLLSVADSTNYNSTNYSNNHYNNSNYSNTMNSMSDIIYQSPDDSLTFSPINIGKINIQSSAVNTHPIISNTTSNTSNILTAMHISQPQSPPSQQRNSAHPFLWNLKLPSYHHNSNNTSTSNNNINIYNNSITDFTNHLDISSTSDTDYLTTKQDNDRIDVNVNNNYHNDINNHNNHNNHNNNNINLNNNNNNNETIGLDQSSFMLDLGDDDLSSIASITSDQHNQITTHSPIVVAITSQQQVTQNNILPIRTSKDNNNINNTTNNNIDINSTTTTATTNNNNEKMQSFPILTRTITKSDDGMESDLSEYAI